MEPISILVTSALFVGAEIARKPADEFASAWSRAKQVFAKVFAEEPVPRSVTESTLAEVIEGTPEIRADVESVFGQVSALRLP